MPDPKDDDERSASAIAKLRDDALRRALNTPPTPHKPIGKSKAKPTKRTAGKGRARVGKAKR